MLFWVNSEKDLRFRVSGLGKKKRGGFGVRTRLCESSQIFLKKSSTKFCHRLYQNPSRYLGPTQYRVGGGSRYTIPISEMSTNCFN